MGTIQIVHQPVQLDVVDKRLQPPSFIAQFKRREDITEHQLNFLDGFLNRGKEAVSKELQFFGDNVQEQINDSGFDWKGLGIITKSTHTLPLTIVGLEVIRAEKIMRADAQHNILVGDREMTSVQMTERRVGNEVVVEKKTSIYILVGWGLLILSVLAIAFFLYTGKFKVNAAGSKQRPVGYQLPFSFKNHHS